VVQVLPAALQAAPPPPPPQPARAPSPSAAAQPGDRVSDVIERHHDVMQSFLETQRNVMLAYLGQDARPLPSRPAARPSRPRAALPAAEAAPAPAPAPPAPAAAPAAAPVAAAAPLPPAPAAPPAATPALDVKARLLAIVGERTGYPAEMLDLDADLESDLGIDSIKRVEIAGTMTEAMALPPGAEVDPEELTRPGRCARS
jgi:acyl carrier protein